MKVEIRTAPFVPWEELGRFEATLAHPRAVGACATFIGSMRDFNDGDPVEAMFLEHYPGMTERHLERLGQEAMARHSLEDLLIIHRVGELRPAEPIVLVAVWSGHRKEAFEACREVMEQLKSTAPFWKKESLASGSRWVEHNTPGY